MEQGCDSSFAGTTADFNSAYAAGVVWWGHYFGGAGVYRVWSNAERQALFNSKIPKHLPIWVPAQSFTSDPYQEAQQAVTAARLLGFNTVIGFDVEHGSGYTLDWGNKFTTVVRADGFEVVCYHAGDKEPPVNAFSWLANWTGNPPTSLAPGSAQQYRGGTNAYGMNVDFDSAADGFPLELNPMQLPINLEGENADMITSFYDPESHQQHVFRERPNGGLVDHWYYSIAHDGNPAVPWQHEVLPAPAQ